MQNGISPEGRHYYPAFPYTAYRLATRQDMADLFAFLQTLPAPTAIAAASGALSRDDHAGDRAVEPAAPP
jgi:hypothetical protein